MTNPTLDQLPPPPPGKTGWPWTEQSRRLPKRMPGGGDWPRISIVTPSYNQGQFIEETIRSILLQGYPNLEYFVLDGASTDNSVEVIRKYSPWITYWVSQPDGGQTAAIASGLNMSSWLYATWINSDDLLYKNALHHHASRIGFDGNTIYAGLCFHTDSNGRIVRSHEGRIHSLEDLLRVRTIWRTGGNMVQPEVLFPRDLYLKVGGVDPVNHFTMDYELWGKLFLAGARIQYTGVPFGMARGHADQKTRDSLRQTRALVTTAGKLLSLADNLPEATRNELQADLDAYWASYQIDHWKNSGRLAKVGLPPSVVNPLRDLRTRFSKTFKTWAK